MFPNPRTLDLSFNTISSSLLLLEGVWNTLPITPNSKKKYAKAVDFWEDGRWANNDLQTLHSGGED